MAAEPVANGIKYLLGAAAGTARVTRGGIARRTRGDVDRMTRGVEDESSGGYELHVGEFPKTPDKVVMIAETGGEPPNPKWLLDFPSIQVTVRGVPSSYEATWAEAKVTKDKLLGIDSQDINNDRWVAINLGSDLAYIGHDEKFRPMFSINFRLIIEPQSTSETNRIAL